MPYPNAKVYSDGSHYIAIPQQPKKMRKKVRTKKNTDSSVLEKQVNEVLKKSKDKQEVQQNNVVDDKTHLGNITPQCNADAKEIMLKAIFDEAYKQNYSQSRNQLRHIMLDIMSKHFEDKEKLATFVDINLERKYHNYSSRMTRLYRKVNLQEWSHFCTFTYDSKKHTEESFRKKLSNCLKHFANRKGWRYIGVWERAPQTQRLHFHGLFYIPDGTLPGKLVETKDYSIITKQVQTTIQSTYFNERFGRNDFEELDTSIFVERAIRYIVKYMEKTGEKIVYSRHLPTYIISDILEDDVVCTCGLEDRKLLLADDFSCYDEGCYMGKVSPEVIAMLRKAN